MPADAPPPSHRWLPAFFSGSFAALATGIYFFLPLYLKGTLHFSGAQIGLLYGVLAVNALVVSFPLGVAGDRYPARNLIRVSLLIAGLAMWGLGQATAFIPYLLIFWAFGLASYVFRQSLDILLFKVSGPDPARSFGRYNTWRMGGMFLGTLGGGGLLTVLDFPQALAVLALGAGLLVPPTFWLPATAVHHAPLRQYRRDFLHRPVLFFAAWLFLFTLHWGAENTSYGLFLTNNLGLTPGEMGLYMSVEFAVLAVTATLHGRYWTGRVKPMVLLGIALCTSGLGHIFMTLPPVLFSLFWRAVHGFGDGLILMESYTTVARLFQVERVGGNSSLISLVTTLGAFAGALIFGPLGAAWGYQWPLIISGLISLLLLPLAWWEARREDAAAAPQGP